jgi:alpha-beta hydrolase superfamily lysophospholipase
MPATAKPSTWLSDILATLAVASGIGYFAMVYGVSRWLTRSSRAIPLPPEWDCTRQELECRTDDGLRLAGWAFTPANPRATIALFHGMRGNRVDVLDRAQMLTQAGYRCVAFDHRAHGQSEGKVTSFGYYEANDVSAVRALIRLNWPDEPCAALGTSMGAAALCYAEPCAWDALILEGLYHDLSEAFRSRIGSEFPAWFRFFAGGVIRLTERRLGQRLENMAPWRHMAKLAPTPILLLTGELDSHATPGDVAKLYDCCGEPREMHIISAAHHSDVFEKGGSHYQELVLDFLNRHLQKRQRLAA